MPPKKDYELGPGKLLWIGPDDETQYEIPTIPKLTLSGFKEDTEKLPCIKLFGGYHEAEMICATKINRKAYLRIILGRSNNWLKMHGYPMVRGRFL